jgi:hypothetical protein
MEWWEKAANYGLPTVLLIGLLWGMARTAAWTRKVVVEPVLKAHLDLIETLKAAVPQQNERLDKVERSAAHVAAGQFKKLDKIAETLENQTEILEKAITYQTQVIEDKDGKRKEEKRA